MFVEKPRFGPKPTNVFQIRNHPWLKPQIIFFNGFVSIILNQAEVGYRGEQYALVCVDQFTGAIMAYPSKSKNQIAVEMSLRHFIGDRAKPLVVSDRYQSILAAIRAVGCASDPTPPNATVKNPLAESAINVPEHSCSKRGLMFNIGLEQWFVSVTSMI